MRSLLFVPFLLVLLQASYYSRPYGSFLKGRSALIDAAARGETIKLGPLIKNSGNTIELTQAAAEATRNGHFDVVKLFWNKDDVNENVIWVEVFCVACESGSLDIGEFLLARRVTAYMSPSNVAVAQMYVGLLYASCAGKVNFIDGVLNVIKLTKDQWYQLIVSACTYGHLPVVERLARINHRLTENESREIFEITLINSHANVMAFILKKGIACASIALTDVEIINDFIVLFAERYFAIFASIVENCNNPEVVKLILFMAHHWNKKRLAMRCIPFLDDMREENITPSKGTLPRSMAQFKDMANKDNENILKVFEKMKLAIEAIQLDQMNRLKLYLVTSIFQPVEYATLEKVAEVSGKPEIKAMLVENRFRYCRMIISENVRGKFYQAWPLMLALGVTQAVQEKAEKPANGTGELVEYDLTRMIPFFGTMTDESIWKTLCKLPYI